MPTLSKTNIKPTSAPIVINVNNLTDEKLYDVKVFDCEFEKQNKIGYSLGVNTMSYLQLMYSLSNNPMIIDSIQVIVTGDYKKFVLRQLNSSLAFINKNVDGCVLTNPTHVRIDPYQFQEYTAIISGLDFELSGLSQIELFHLMPEVSVKFLLYPGKAINIAAGLRGKSVVK